MQGYKQALGEKLILAKLLLRIQQSCEEHETCLRCFLSPEDVEQLASENNPLRSSDVATLGTKYLHAVCNQSLRSFIAGDDIVSQYYTNEVIILCLAHDQASESCEPVT